MTFASQNLTAGQLNAIVKKLGGHEGALCFLRGETFVSTDGLHGTSVWKRVRLGLHKSPSEYREAIKKAGFEIGGWDEMLLGKVICAQEEVSLDLVVRSVAGLGFKNRARLEEVYARASELGFELCPAEVGPALRLQYTDQPSREWMMIAMDPFTDQNGCCYLFEVSCGNDVGLLNGHRGLPDHTWERDTRFVFVRR